MLYHPDCNDVVAEHMRSLAKKVDIFQRPVSHHLPY